VYEHGLKNRLKIREIGPDRFYRFLVNRSVNLKFLNKMKNFEIKKSKKTRADFKIFGQTRIRNFKVTEATKFGEGETEGKPRKKKKTVGS
jgi:hypothetical protein